MHFTFSSHTLALCIYISFLLPLYSVSPSSTSHSTIFVGPMKRTVLVESTSRKTRDLRLATEMVNNSVGATCEMGYQPQVGDTGTGYQTEVTQSSDSQPVGLDISPLPTPQQMILSQGLLIRYLACQTFTLEFITVAKLVNKRATRILLWFERSPQYEELY